MKNNIMVILMVIIPFLQGICQTTYTSDSKDVIYCGSTTSGRILPIPPQCQNGSPLLLDQYEVPAFDSGVWSGNGVTLTGTNYYFNPVGMPFQNKVYYSYQSATDSVIIMVLVPTPVSILTTINSLHICYGDLVDLSPYGNPSGGTWTSNYPGAISENVLNTSLVADTATVINLVYEFEQNGCSDTDTKALVINHGPVFNWNLVDNAFCQNGESVLFSVNNPTAQFSINGLLLENNTLIPSDWGIGNHNVLCTTTATNGCISTKTEMITIMDYPKITSISDSIAICVGSSVDLSVGIQNPPIGQTASYLWSSNPIIDIIGGGTNQITASPVVNSLFNVVINYTNGCSVMDSVKVSVMNGQAEIGFTRIVDNQIQFTTGVSTIYFWDFGDGQRSYIQNPIHTFTQIGTYTVTLLVNECSQQFSNTIEIVVSQIVVGIEENIRDQEISLFPNPATNQINLDFGKAEASLVQIYDLTGKLVLSKPVKGYNTQIDVSSIIPGIYSIKILDETSRGYKNLLFVKE